MAIYTEKITDKKTGQKIDKIVDGKKQYYIRAYIKDENGNKKQITRHNKEWLGRDGYWKAQQEENRLGKKIIKVDKNLPFKSLIDEFLNQSKKNNKESTLVTYESCINSQFKFWNNKKITEINLSDFEEWHNQLEEKKLSLKYKNKCHSIMTSILALGVRKEYFDRNFEDIIGPFKISGKEKEKIVVNEKIRYITYEQFKKLTSSIDSIYWYTIVNFMYLTGMRKGEIQALTWKEIDFKNRIIKVNKTLTRKTKDSKGYKITSTKGIKNRTIDISELLLKVLYDYYKAKKTKDENEFIFGGDKPLSQTTLDNNLKKWFKKANIVPITPHEFRHSHVSLLINEYLKEGNTDTTKFFIIVGKRLGHSLEVMQRTYLHLFPNIQNDIIKLLDKLEKQDQKQDQEK